MNSNEEKVANPKLSIVNVVIIVTLLVLSVILMGSGEHLIAALTIVTLLLYIGFISGAFSDKETQKLIKEHGGFSETIKISSADMLKYISIDEERKKLMIVDVGNTKHQRMIYNYADVLGVELFEDGDSVTSTKRGSQIGRVVVGTALLGGVGAIIGGFSGKKKTSSTANRIEVRITLDDIANPIFDLRFLKHEVNKSSSEYEKSNRSARHALAVIEAMIRQDGNEREEGANSAIADASAVPAPAQTSIADEIGKLNSLYKSGILTEDEFNAQKAKILNQ